MITKVVNIFFIVGIMAAMSCASGSTSKTSPRSSQHREDLSVYRPEINVKPDSLGGNVEAETTTVDANLVPENDITSELNTVLDSINQLKKDINYIDGFTVQVYTGINREMANDAKAKVYTTLPDSRPVIIYDQPNFKVKVGKFYTRREAHSTLASLRRVFPAAIIIPERIPIENQ